MFMKAVIGVLFALLAVPVALGQVTLPAQTVSANAAPETVLTSTGSVSAPAYAVTCVIPSLLLSVGATSVGEALLTCTTAPYALTVTVTPPPPPPGGNCNQRLGSTPVIFCDSFDAPMPVAGTRTGALDPNVWGVSRLGAVNLGQASYNLWNQTRIVNCDGTTSTVTPPNDVIICNGQLREALNDNGSGVFEGGGVYVLAMYPKQPFDFAGRTGTISFDVSNDTDGPHSAWPEFWVTDAPVPAPFAFNGGWLTLPANGLVVRMAAGVPVGNQWPCANSNNINRTRWTIDSAGAVRNYVYEDANYAGTDGGVASTTPLKITILDCVTEPPPQSGIMNHVELRVSPNEIDVYATDAGVAPTSTTLRKIAIVTNANLSFSRGLVWLEDAHYNADKGGTPSQAQHTFMWDNLAFDGPFTQRDFSYDAPDNTVNPGLSYSPNSVNLGRFSAPNQTATWKISGIPANPQPATMKVLFNFSTEGNANPTVLNVIVNGNALAVPWTAPQNMQATWDTYAVVIPVADLVAGTNTVQLGTDVAAVFSNVDIVLAAVPGGVPVLPGANNAYP
jgi:hypothetical protein